ncbi:MAG: MCE family protein [Deltaproteobacteria bacterium]|nr:MCE family protein [Deltaproteobacteria bacterium]
MTIKQNDPRFKNLELKTGIMVAVAVLGIVAVFIMIGLEKDLFTTKYRLHFTSESGSGFVEGMPVKLSGFKVGRVKKIELTEDAKVRTVTELNKKYEKWIRHGSVARLSKEGLIGDPYVEITVGDGTKRTFADGDSIPFEKAGGMEELITEMKPILTEVKDIIHYVNSPDGDIKVMLGNLKDLTSEVKETRKTLDQTLRDASAAVKNADRLVINLNDKSSSAIENVNRAFLRLEPIMVKIENITDKAGAAAEKFPATVEKIDRIADNVKILTDGLVGETPRIREILINADETLRESKTMIKGVKESWPLRLMAPPAKSPELIPFDSFLLDNNGHNGKENRIDKAGNAGGNK